MKIEVLLSCMYQKDFSILDNKNIVTDVLIVNQCEINKILEKEENGVTKRMIFTNDKGLSRSRNHLLNFAKGDICLLCDDDVIYQNDYKKSILEAFENIPEADIIVFDTTMVNYKGASKRDENSIKKIKRAPKFKFYGSVRIAFKRKSIEKHNISFNTLFGAGAVFNSGEESLFLNEARKKGLKIFEYPKNIATVDYSTSSWFDGYNAKYFFDKGAWLSVAFPYLKVFFKWYYIYALRNETELKFYEILKYMKKGEEKYKNID